MHLAADLGGVLGSPVWTVLATVLAAIAIGVSIWLGVRRREHKAFSYRIKVAELVSIRDEAKDQIKIYFADEQIEQATLLHLQLVNSGNMPILEADFQRPLALKFEDSGTPLTADLSTTAPSTLNPVLEIHNQEVLLQPLLLNPSDEVTAKLIVRDFTDVEFDSRRRKSFLSESSRE